MLIHSEEVSARNGPSSAIVPRFEKQGYSDEAVAARRKWVEEKTGATLTHVGSYSLSSEQMRGNIENPIGTIQMPVGVAGPLLIHGSYAQGTFYVPLATTEGALLRSYERGMVTLTRSGGVTARIYLDENRVSPVFLLPDVAAAHDFAAQLNQSFPIIKREA
ncbi:MAG TPA: hydroxymethylglutaryl-CoA reductase, partial [Candidatus Angelobacter sp.]